MLVEEIEMSTHIGQQTKLVDDQGRPIAIEPLTAENLQSLTAAVERVSEQQKQAQIEAFKKTIAARELALGRWHAKNGFKKCPACGDLLFVCDVHGPTVTVACVQTRTFGCYYVEEAEFTDGEIVGWHRYPTFEERLEAYYRQRGIIKDQDQHGGK